MARTRSLEARQVTAGWHTADQAQLRAVVTAGRAGDVGRPVYVYAPREELTELLATLLRAGRPYHRTMVGSHVLALQRQAEQARAWAERGNDLEAAEVLARLDQVDVLLAEAAAICGPAR